MMAYIVACFWDRIKVIETDASEIVAKTYVSEVLDYEPIMYAQDASIFDTSEFVSKQDMRMEIAKKHVNKPNTSEKLTVFDLGNAWSKLAHKT